MIAALLIKVIYKVNNNLTKKCYDLFRVIVST